MIEIKLEEATSLTLEMQIEGDVKKDDTQLRFSVVSEGIRYSFAGREVEKGVYQIEFPVMSGLITEGQYPAEVEIMVDGKYFVPLEETIKFTKAIKPTVKLAEGAVQSAGPDQSAFKIKLAAVQASPPETIVESVKGIVATLTQKTNEGQEIDTALALNCLHGLVSGEGYHDREARVRARGKGQVNEAEVLAAIRFIHKYGTDVESNQTLALTGSTPLSERAQQEVAKALMEKGMSARSLRAKGFLLG